MEIRADDLTGEQTLDLLRTHLAGMQDNSPVGHVFALDLSGLQRSDVSVWSVWDAEKICGIGALRQLDMETAEIKSMRTHPDHLRKGVAARLLDYLIEVARRRNIRRVYLETGSGAAFDPAIALYRRRGFTSCDAFGDYTKSDFNQFMCLDLAMPSHRP